MKLFFKAKTIQIFILIFIAQSILVSTSQETERLGEEFENSNINNNESEEIDIWGNLFLTISH